MKLVVLGSGTSVPHPQRASAAFWLETKNGSVLLDCSGDAAHRMAAENLDWPNLDAIWISHLHLDHCGGLANLLFGMKWAPQTQDRLKPLNIFGCEGMERLLKAIDESHNYELRNQHFLVHLHEIKPFAEGLGTEFEILSNVRARTFSTPHTRESLAIRLTDATGLSVVYSSDTGYSEELGDFAEGADLLIIDCSFRRNKPVANHLELQEAMRLASLAAPRKVLLTHLYPEWDGVDIEAEARNHWRGDVIAACDGLIIDLEVSR